MNRKAGKSVFIAAAAAILVGSVAGGPLAAAAQVITDEVKVVAQGAVGQMQPSDEQTSVVAHNFMGG
ncbi:hypothetical protein [Streptomyces sp. NPDC057694]|uniref:hypothetical protein n=1 Tax=Streptomyces sp. NPDC057694 TaxID=3346216 RepID=UPI0036816412